mgnify:CR=1 FL=1
MGNHLLLFREIGRFEKFYELVAEEIREYGERCLAKYFLFMVDAVIKKRVINSKTR